MKLWRSWSDWARSVLCRSALGLIALGAAGSALAQASIESVTGSIQSGAEVVRIDLTQPLSAVPEGFVVQSPARIALDFQGVANGLGKNQVQLNQGNVRAVNVVEAGGRTRVVLNLNRATNYRAELQGKSLLIMLDPVAAQASVAAPRAPMFAESRADVGMLPLRDIDFRRGVESSGRVIVDLASNQVGVDIRQQGQNLVVEFLKTSLPQGLSRRLDVSDFGTPVQTITTTQSGDRVRMVIEPRGQWEHSAYQSDSQLVVEVRQQKVNPDKLTKGTGYSGEKLSLNFQNIEVRSLLQVIADFTNFNIVTSDSVQGSLTLRLNDVPWDQALDIILQAKGLGMKRNGNVLQIAPKEELAAKEKAELEALAAVQNLEPLRTQSFQLNYTKAVDIARQLMGTGIAGMPGGAANAAAARILSTRGSVIAEPRTNQIFVSDIPAKLAQVQEMISKLDIAVRQVLIEARIVEASDSFGRSLGVRLGGADLRGVNGGDAGYGLGNGNRIAFGGSYNAAIGTTVPGQSQLMTYDTSGDKIGSTNFLNLPAQGFNGYAAPSLALSLFNSAANRFLNLEISAMEADGKGKIVSSPGGDGRSDQGHHRAGHGVRVSAGHLQRRYRSGFPQGGVEPGSDAADHARGQRHSRSGRQQRQPRYRGGQRHVDQHQEGPDTGSGRKWRHRGHRRDLHDERGRSREQGSSAGRYPGAGQSFQEQNEELEEAGNAGVHYAQNHY